jgi:hypothetical protein
LFGKVIVVLRVLEFVESIAIQVGSGDEAEIMRCFGKSRHIIDISIFVFCQIYCISYRCSPEYWLLFCAMIEADGSSANTTGT